MIVLGLWCAAIMLRIGVLVRNYVACLQNQGRHAFKICGVVIFRIRRDYAKHIEFISHVISRIFDVERGLSTLRESLRTPCHT